MSKKKRVRPRAVTPATDPSSVPVASDQPGLFNWPRVLATAEPLSLVVFFVYLLAHSWLRWMDPLIDFPRDLYLSWRVSEGEMLYQQLANWYGPLSQLVQAAAFRVFGVGIDTVIWTNIALTAAVVFLLRDIFFSLGNRLSGWLAAMVFVGVFAVGNYSQIANYNFIAPYVSQSTYCFAGLVVVLWGLVHHLKSERPGWLGAAGFGLAVAYLNKPEALLAAAGSLAVYFTVRVIRAARSQPPKSDWRAAARWVGPASIWLAGGFFSLWLPVFLYFLVRGGLGYAILATDFVPYSVLNDQFRHTLLTAHTQLGFFGFDQPGKNFVRQSVAGGLLVLVCGVMVVAARAWTRVTRQSVSYWVWPGVVFAMGSLGAWLAEYKAGYWGEIGAAFIFPVIIAAFATVAWSLWAAWTGRVADWSRPLGLAVVGVAAALMLVRMILNGRIVHFGFFMMPLAVLWIVHGVVFEGARAVPGGLRANRLLPAAFSLLTLTGIGALTWASIHNYALKNYEVGEGRDHFYTFGPEMFYNGQVMDLLGKVFKEKTPTAKTLVVFPEGIAVNYHLRIPTTLAEMDFQPVALAYAGPAHVLEELKARPPESIIFYDRDFSEFGVPYFGVDEANGRNLVLWINDHYWLAGIAGQTTKTVSHHEIDILKLRTPGSSGVELLRDALLPPSGSP
jgi:hypothetical protein